MLLHDHIKLCGMILWKLFNTVNWVRVIFRTLDLTFEPFPIILIHDYSTWEKAQNLLIFLIFSPSFNFYSTQKL